MPEQGTEEFFEAARRGMVEQIALHATLVADRIHRPQLADRVMAVMSTVPRHEFVPPELRLFAYLDQPLPIGYGKTISQPFIVALMTDLLDVQPEDRVLEIGTGLGYQAAVLAKLAAEVCTVEIIEELAEDARSRLQAQGFDNVVVRIGDGSHGCLEHAPYDKIIVTAAPDLIPPALLGQLRPGGKMTIPTGLEGAQNLVLAQKDAGGAIDVQEILPVRFSQMVVTH